MQNSAIHYNDKKTDLKTENLSPINSKTGMTKYEYILHFSFSSYVRKNVMFFLPRLPFCQTSCPTSRVFNIKSSNCHFVSFCFKINFIFFLRKHSDFAYRQGIVYQLLIISHCKFKWIIIYSNINYGTILVLTKKG